MSEVGSLARELMLRSAPHTTGLVIALALASCGVKRYQHVEAPHACPPGDEQDETPCGTVSNTDSALRPSEVWLASDIAAVLDRHEPSQSDVIASGTLGARISHRIVSAYASATGAALGIYPSVRRADGQPPYSHVDRGNVQGGLAARWLKVPPASGNSYRRALALRGDVSYGGDASPEDGAILNRRPFSLMQFAPNWNGQLIGEVRYELVGCFAPFLHAQFGAMMLDTDQYAFPSSLTIGARRDETLTIYGEYGALVRTRFGHAVSTATRFRIGLEWDVRDLAEIANGHRKSRPWDAIRYGAAFELNLGSIDGVFFGLTASVPFTVTR